MASPAPQPISFAEEPRRVLLVLPTWVGDVVMATPFIRALFERFASAEITLLMHRHLHDLLAGSPWVQRVLFWPPRGKGADARRARRELLEELRARRFDLAVMLPNSLRSAWLCWRAGATRRLGFDRDGRGLLLTDAVEPPNRRRNKGPDGSMRRFEPLPLVDYYAHLALTLGCAHPGDALQLFTTEQDDAAVSRCLDEHGADPAAPLVVICPGANFGASKCWAPERFAAVADQLVERRGAVVAISPGPGEEPLAQAIQHAMQQPSLLLIEPCLTLGELKSLIARSALLLGNDTGPRHFARAFDIHRVTVFGPTEVRWTDTSHGAESIVRVDVPCGPCHKKVCPLEHQICMERVSVEMVARACERELEAALAQT